MKELKDLDEESKTRTVLFITLFSFLCGLCLALFATVKGPIHFVFSLLAFIIGLRVFGRVDRIKPRVWFVVISIIWYLLLTTIITMVTYLRDNPMPAAS
ncbi:hypothetical protein [Paenibacillus xylaniclasticus]|uniref:hypothetical protein n=1 Tax=Paenibacillus xylaniclasticus TaxID=588083 RepID=UPI000FDA1570|nr:MULTISPECIES: hypothetical protein [Paenibacillus]GFN31979.1 hypothetical protein PCURB6_22390 [Paenibacillus curdlanolyticus]